MKVLSVKNPWAYLIIFYGKDIENRTKKTNYRGRIAIHCSKKSDLEGWDALIKSKTRPELRAAVEAIIKNRAEIEKMNGHIIGTVDLYNCTYPELTAAANPSVWAGVLSPWHWWLKDPHCDCRAYTGARNVRALGVSGFMNYLSVFSGIEAASVAWGGLGFKPVGFSEIDPFACAVLAYHFPDIKNFGDINNFKEWKIDEPIRIVVGGSPCQSFSFAGHRKGIEDVRGRLMLTYGNMVNHFKPAWVVWENVPGVLSTNGGHDFADFLSMLEKCGYGVAWRVLDVQFFGVPQCRRRVFVICNFGSVHRAAAVLFDTDAMQEYNTALHEGGGRCGNTPAGIVSGIEEESLIILLDYGGSIIRVKHDKLNTITASDASHPAIVYYRYKNKTILRHLMPIEDERLQGFPDDWTRVPYNGKPREKCPDSVRYKAIGNSMAVPVMRWIGERIKKIELLFNDTKVPGGVKC